MKLLLAKFIMVTALALLAAKSPLGDLSDEELEKMMKKYGIDSKDLGVLSDSSKKGGEPNDKTRKQKSSKEMLMDLSEDDDSVKSILSDKKGGKSNLRNKVNMEEEYYKNREVLKHFDMTSRDAFNLVRFMSQFRLFNRLPIVAMNIIEEVHRRDSFKKILESQNSQSQETSRLVANTLNSQVFMDHENQVGRKGMLTLVGTDPAEVTQVWAVANSKVVSIYSSSNNLNIIRLYRVASLRLKDSLYSPCFFICYEDAATNQYKQQSLLCAINFKEKEYWKETIEYHQREYKDLEQLSNHGSGARIARP